MYVLKVTAPTTAASLASLSTGAPVKCSKMIVQSSAANSAIVYVGGDGTTTLELAAAGQTIELGPVGTSELYGKGNGSDTLTGVMF